MSEKEIPTRDELKKLKVVNLRQRLSKLSLPQGGEMIDIQCHSISGKIMLSKYYTLIARFVICCL